MDFKKYIDSKVKQYFNSEKKKKLYKLFFGERCRNCKKGFMNIINNDNYECGLCHYKIKKSKEMN